MKALLIVTSFLVLISCTEPNSKFKTDQQKIASQIDPVLEKHPFNGVILIASDDGIVYSKAVGYSDLKRKIPMQLNDQFVIGSISKQITAVMVMQAFENGKLNLTDTIDQFLPEIQQPWVHSITIHQLLTHTHGIVELNHPTAFEPGSGFQYSQLGYELLAQILEKINKKSFESQAETLFKKHGLNNTFHPNSKQYRRLVKGYEKDSLGQFEYTVHSLENYPAAGSFISNATDLTKWTELLYGGRLVSKETLKLMSTKYAVRMHPILHEVGYGYGLLFKDGEENIQIGTLGYAPGFASICHYYPTSGMSLVVLQNTITSNEDFKKTFVTHSRLMRIIKEHSRKL